MASFHDQLIKAKQIKPDVIERELFEYIKLIKPVLIELNRDQINEKSQDIYGNAIGFYSRATEIITKGAKKQGEPFDGKDTGNWLKSFYVSVNDGLVLFGASDPKTDDILDSPNWLSVDLFGLNPENQRTVIRERLLPFVLNHYRQKLDL